MAGVQLGLAGLVVLAGAAGGQALAAVAGWWTVYGGLVDSMSEGVKQIVYPDTDLAKARTLDSELRA